METYMKENTHDRYKKVWIRKEKQGEKENEENVLDIIV
jgi:hypothetical protein